MILSEVEKKKTELVCTMIAHHEIDPGVTFRMPKKGLFFRIGTGFSRSRD
jgi:hypothetical protein